MSQNVKQQVRRFSLLSVAAALVLTVIANHATAETIFESGTLGPTAKTWNDLLAETVGGTNISSDVFTGVRFELTQSVVTTQIGGHFLQRPGGDPQGDGSFFGAIVALDDESDFPDSGNLMTMDVVGATLLSFPDPSNEVFGNISLRLDPGWYALVFGSGLFGATAGGVALRNNTDIGEPTYIGWQTGAPGSGWFSLTGLSTIFVDHRFAVLGTIVPEPSPVLLMPLAVVLSLRRRD